MEITGPGAAGIDKSRRPTAPRHLGRIDAERGPAPIDMRVEIDQPGHDEEPAGVDNVAAAGEIMPDRGHLSIAASDVGRLVAPACRIDNPSAADNQICHVTLPPGHSL